MISIIYGDKGAGKTKKMIDSANQSVYEAKGAIVYIDKNTNRMHDLAREIRLVDATHFGINQQSDFVAFVKGMLATNYDIEKIYVDGLAKIVNKDIADMAEVYAGLENIAKEFDVQFVITASCDKENLPDFIAKYVK